MTAPESALTTRIVPWNASASELTSFSTAARPAFFRIVCRSQKSGILSLYGR